MKRLNVVILAVLCIGYAGLLVASSSSSKSDFKFDPQIFKQYAQKFGNKTANLRELERVAQNINRDKQIKTKFAVPQFFGISHQEVVDFLKSIVVGKRVKKVAEIDDWSRDDLFDKDPPRSKTAFGEIQKNWKNFVRYQKYTDKTTITHGAKKALAKIRKIIYKAFKKTFDIGDNRRAALIEFVKNAHNEKELLMVRSTGREDSKKLSNAGGNESVSSVKPDIADVSKAMGKVVASYFSKKSIGQRLSFDDKSLYNDPFTPVLLQQMIGELAGAKAKMSTSSSSFSSSSSSSMQQFKTSNILGDVSSIPASGVAFFPEAEARTSGVATIQATWGHNEAVVNGLVPVDSFYVGSSDVVHPLIRIKKNRLITNVQGTGLKLTQNPADLHKKPSLPKQQVLDIRRAIQIIKDYYDYPVDIEFVYLNNTIYLVQVRPLEEQKMSPEYIDPKFLADIQSDQKSQGTAIGVGGANVRIVESASQVIIKDTINMALSEFLKRDDKYRIKAVIVGQMAPSTSHEATIFRAHNKPVLKADIALVQQWVKKQAFPLVFDPQQEIVFIAPSVDDVKQHVLKGWYDHPISKKVSVMPQYIKKLNGSIAKILAPSELFKGDSTTVVLNVIRQGEKEEVVKALKTLLSRVAQAITRQSIKQAVLKKEYKETESRLIAQLKQIYMHLATTAGELYEIMQRKHSRLERLYPFVFIKALIQQVPDPSEIVNNVSFVAILKTELIEQKLMQQLKGVQLPERARIVQYAKAGDSALIKEVRDNWLSYLTSFDKDVSKEQKKRFSRMMHALAQLDVLPMWLNVSFAQSYKKSRGNTAKVTQSLLDEYEQSIGFIKKLEEMKQLIDSMNMESWEKPEMFEKQMKKFKRTILSYFSAHGTGYDGRIVRTFFEQDLKSGIYRDVPLLKAFRESGVVGKLAAISVMRRLVEIFDTSIKALKGSLFYRNREKKIQNFISMIRVYLDLLNTWGSFETEDDHGYISGQMLDGFFGINMYFYGLSGLGASQLFPSGNFSVASATIGSGALWNRSHSGKFSAEDLFSVVHQDLLMIISMLSDGILSGVTLPNRLNSLNESLFKGGSRRMRRLGLDIGKDFIKIYYNLPLRNHSCTIMVIYDRFNQDLHASIKFIGFNLDGRWNFIAKIISTVAPAFGWSFVQKPKLTGKNPAEVLSFVLDLNKTDSFYGFRRFLSILADATLFNQLVTVHTKKTILRGIFKLAHNAENKLIKGTAFDLIYQLNRDIETLIGVLRNVITDDELIEGLLPIVGNHAYKLSSLIKETSPSKEKVESLKKSVDKYPYLFIPLIIKEHYTIDDFLKQLEQAWKRYSKDSSILKQWNNAFVYLVQSYEIKKSVKKLLWVFLENVDKFQEEQKFYMVAWLLDAGPLAEKDLNALAHIVTTLDLKHIKKIDRNGLLPIDQIVPIFDKMLDKDGAFKLKEKKEFVIGWLIRKIKKRSKDKNLISSAKMISSWKLNEGQKNKINKYLKLHESSLLSPSSNVNFK